VVGVAITRAAGEVCEIESFLLSCRVIGRTIETAVLAFLAQRSRSEGARVLEGWFVPTPKNAPARHVYRDHGFQPAGNRDGAALWRLDLDAGRPACPPWVRLCYAGENLATEHAHA
jgi:predicted enzyme involved in methoxymalonyl-ACP biosynthesis